MTGVKLYYCGEGTGAMYETDCREDLGYGLYVSYADYAALQAALLAKSAAYDALVAGIDLNDHVMVKLNAHGMAILKAQHEALRAAAPSVREWTPPKVDADGFSKHQLWCLFQDFGPHISLPARKPFDAMRLLVSDDRPSHNAGDGK